LPTTEEESTPTPEWSVPPESPWADAPETGNPFTPDGTATVVDNATSDDGKEFFTFQTPEGNVFFLIIDRSRPNNNVYFLNAVTEQDLMALAVASLPPSDFSPIPDPLPIPEPDDEAEIPEIPIVAESESGNNGTLIFIVIAALAFGGAAYYLKIVRPKKQAAGFDDEDEEYDYDEEEEFDDEDDELEEVYDVEDIIREFGSGRQSEEFEPNEEEERLFDEIQ